MISAQTRSAFVARKNRCTHFRIMLSGQRYADGNKTAMTDKTVSLPEGPRHAGFIRNNLRNYSMLLSLFAIMLFFQVVTDGTLLQPLNLTNLVLQEQLYRH